MTKQEPTNEIESPRLYATLIGLSASAFSVVFVLVLLTPVTAFFNPELEVIVAISIGTAFSVFWIGYMYGLLRYCKMARARLQSIIDSLPSVTVSKVVVDVAEVESPIGEGFIKITGTPTTVRVTDGIEIAHVQALAGAGLQAVSQRALDNAGVITRDPTVKVNAGTFIKWLRRNGFIKPIGNSRYEFTPLGTALLKSAGGTRGSQPPTTTTE